MFFKDRVIEEKVKNLEESNKALNARVDALDQRYAIKLVEKIVFGFVGLALIALASAWIAQAVGVIGG